MTGEAQ